MRAWEPASKFSRDETAAISHTVLAMPDIQIKMSEDIFRRATLGMDWDIGLMIYEAEEPSKNVIRLDGKRAGVFLLHGGTSDYKSLEPVALTLAAKFGFKVVSMTFPGRLYLLDPSRDWPGDTMNADGTARTPLWTRQTQIAPDQYEIVKDISKRKSYGTIISLKAKEGSEFYYRMAAWPAAFEEGMQEAARRHFPLAQYSIYIHGHSTGGPFAMLASQRIPNIAGILGYGTSPFGYMYAETTGDSWNFPFNYLRLRTWRDTARYLYEDPKIKQYGLPMLMELTFERWERQRKRPNFKAEDFVHKNSVASLEQAAQVSAKRVKLNQQETEALVRRYVGYCRELSGPGVKPVPPFLSLHGIDDNTVTLERCQKSLALFAAMSPAPKVRCVSLGAGIHTWGYSAEDLPKGVVPVVAKLWHDAIAGGYFAAS